MEQLFLGIISIFIVGATSSLILQRNASLANFLSSLFAIIGSVLTLFLSSTILLTQNQLVLNYQTSFPLLNLAIKIDSLSAFFLFIISIVSLTSSIYGSSYMKKFAKSYNLGVFGFFYNLFIASLILVSTASNGLYFLLVWELMSLTSYFLVIFENKIKENVKAGIIYLVMTHFGTAFILLSFTLLYAATGSLDFSFIKEHSANIPILTKNIIFVLALIGFGTKAGIIPLHIWLPRAHPAAPSHVSALMSGVMIKTAILMLIRLFLDILPSDQVWWGLTILIAGAVSSILGVLYALSEHDIKKLLAYHSVENIGIILMGLGSALTFYALGLIPLTILATIATLYHTINHAVFKSLLFLGAGSVVYQTHTHNIEEYGGLLKKMPYTAFFFLIGSVAISAMPPFNGFASEWLTYQSLFAGVVAKSTFIKASFALAISSLAFTGGLAAACFVKAFAITFLAKPRSKESATAKESPFSMNISMAALAILCLVLGLSASFITPQLSNITSSLATMQNGQTLTTSVQSSVKVNSGYASMDLLSVFLALTVILLLVFGLVYLKTRKQREERVDTWDCGAPPLTTRAEITSTGFARSLIVMFGGILKPTKQTDVEYNDAESRYFLSSKTVILSVPNLYERYLYHPMQSLLALTSSRIGIIQNGNVNQYLLYIFIVLIGLLVWSRY